MDVCYVCTTFHNLFMPNHFISTIWDAQSFVSFILTVSVYRAYCSTTLMRMTDAHIINNNNNTKKMKDVIRTDSFDCVRILTEWHNANEIEWNFKGDAKDEDISAWRFIYHSHPHKYKRMYVLFQAISFHTLSINLILSLQKR